MVDSVGLDELTGRGDLWPSGVVSADSGLPCSVKAVVAAENPPHTTERHQDAEYCREVMPDNFGAPLQLMANTKHLGSNLRRDSPRVAVRRGGCGGNAPATSALLVCEAYWARWPVGI